MEQKAVNAEPGHGGYGPSKDPVARPKQPDLVVLLLCTPASQTRTLPTPAEPSDSRPPQPCVTLKQEVDMAICTSILGEIGTGVKSRTVWRFLELCRDLQAPTGFALRHETRILACCCQGIPVKLVDFPQGCATDRALRSCQLARLTILHILCCPLLAL